MSDINVYVGSNYYQELIFHVESRVVLSFHPEQNYPPHAEFQEHMTQTDHQRVYLHTPYTLIPRASFDANDIATYLREVFVFEEIVDYEYVFIDEIVCLYVINPQIHEKINAHFSTFEVHHVMEILLPRMNRFGPSVHLHWFDQAMSVIVWNERLMLAQRYAVHSSQDALYYLLSAYHHGQLSQGQHPLFISGEIDQQGTNYDLIRQYIKDIRLASIQVTLPEHLVYQPHHLYGLIS